jgi:tetratricopeptide (TPR) repeat protein
VVATGWALGAGRWLIGVVGVLGVGAAGSWLWLGDPGSAVTLQSRLAMWWQAAGVALGAWLAGTGGGTFGLAIQPAHTDFNLWSHAHNELVEWVVETGLVGVVAAVVALWLARPGPARNPRRALPITLAVAAIGVHALVDFPLQIPALAMATAGLFATRRSVHEPRVTVRPVVVRAVLGVLVLLQLVAAGWELRTRQVERAIAVLDAQRYQLDAESVVATLAPWRPELALARGWRKLAGDDPDGAVAVGLAVAADHPHDGSALRRAGRLLVAAGATEDALRVLDRARVRFPGDWRTSVARARATDPEHRWEVWSEALRGGAPPSYLEEAFESLPEGVVWLDVAEERDGRFAQVLGGLLLRREQPETALLAFELAARMDPELTPHQGHIRLLIERGQLQEAGALAARGGAAPQYRALQAQVLEASGHGREALETWTALAREAPMYSYRALQAARRVDGVEAAIALGEALVERGVLDPRGQIELARQYRDNGHAAQCQRVLRDDLLTHRSLGVMAQRLHDGGCDKGEVDGPGSVEVTDP